MKKLVKKMQVIKFVVVAAWWKGYTEGFVRAARRQGRDADADEAILRYYRLMVKRGYQKLNI